MIFTCFLVEDENSEHSLTFAGERESLHSVVRALEDRIKLEQVPYCDDRPINLILDLQRKAGKNHELWMPYKRQAFNWKPSLHVKIGDSISCTSLSISTKNSTVTSSCPL
jgi:hypothetical protein